jgi:hypothetical protein
MNANFRITSKLELFKPTAFVTPLHRASGVLVLLVIVLGGFGFESTNARFKLSASQGTNPQEVAAAIKSNAEALKAFSYQQRMQLQLKGETKKVTLTQMSYDMNGNLQKTQISENPPPDAQQQPSGGRRGGRLKQAVVAKKTGEFKEMMGGIADLVKSYTELPPDRLQAALKQAIFSDGQGDMAGSVQILMRNVNQNGDSMTIWIDRTAMLFRRAVIATTYEGNPVTTTANYAMLPSGEVYMGQAILTYPKKEVVVQIDNSDYQKSQ